MDVGAARSESRHVQVSVVSPALKQRRPLCCVVAMQRRLTRCRLLQCEPGPRPSPAVEIGVGAVSGERGPGAGAELRRGGRWGREGRGPRSASPRSASRAACPYYLGPNPAGRDVISMPSARPVLRQLHGVAGAPSLHRLKVSEQLAMPHLKSEAGGPGASPFGSALSREQCVEVCRRDTAARSAPRPAPPRPAPPRPAPPRPAPPSLSHPIPPAHPAPPRPAPPRPTSVTRDLTAVDNRRGQRRTDRIPDASNLRNALIQRLRRVLRCWEGPGSGDSPGAAVLRGARVRGLPRCSSVARGQGQGTSQVSRSQKAASSW